MKFVKPFAATIMTAAALALPVSALGQAQTQDQSRTGSSTGGFVGGTSSAGQSSDAQTAGSRDRSGQSGQTAQGFNEQRFIQAVQSTNQLEVQLGQLAQQRAQRDDVKQFAQQMVQEHQQAQQQFQQIIQRAGGQSGQGQSGQGQSSQSSAQLLPVHQAELQMMQQLQGAEFERAYVVGQAADHLKTVLKFRDASMYAQNDQVKQFATQMLPSLQRHLQHAMQLAGADESAITAGASERGSRSGSSIHSDHGTTGSGTTGGSTSGSTGGTTGSGRSQGTGSGSSTGSDTDRSSTGPDRGTSGSASDRSTPGAERR